MESIRLHNIQNPTPVMADRVKDAFRGVKKSVNKAYKKCSALFDAFSKKYQLNKKRKKVMQVIDYGSTILQGATSASKVSEALSVTAAVSEGGHMVTRVFSALPLVSLVTLPYSFYEMYYYGKQFSYSKDATDAIDNRLKFASAAVQGSGNVTSTAATLGQCQVIPASQIAWSGIALNVIGIVGSVIGIAMSVVDIKRNCEMVNSLSDKSKMKAVSPADYKKVFGVKGEKVEKLVAEKLFQYDEVNQKAESVLKDRLRKQRFSHALSILMYTVTLVASVIFLAAAASPVGFALVALACTIYLGKKIYDAVEKARFNDALKLAIVGENRREHRSYSYVQAEGIFTTMDRRAY